ncbi:MAG: hypothetical protein HOE48_10010 [Candidatus Latescibacteria bacterium]|jgi:hypothetical protein|nr:hypothetical protein [Candidatus Latescibacterota bacterium]MBT5829845.1 hypothetical protein [Candidatus Latescibacterota bacterium]
MCKPFIDSRSHPWAQIPELIECCVHADAALKFDIFYGMSNNDWRWVDIEHARKTVGYDPQDRAEDNHVY